MNEHDRHHSILRETAPGWRKFASEASCERGALTPELQKYLHIMGPTPKRCLEALADLGLTDAEIGRYFRMPARFVTDLRRIWNID